MSTLPNLRAVRDELVRTYGAALPFQVGMALRIIGKRGEVHPRDACAFAYRTEEHARAFAAADLEHFGHPTLGIQQLETGPVVGVLDLRPALKELGVEPTDPALPDDWRPIS